MIRSQIPTVQITYVGVGLILGFFLIGIYDRVNPVRNSHVSNQEYYYRLALAVECQRLLPNLQQSKPSAIQQSLHSNTLQDGANRLLNLDDHSTHRDNTSLADELFRKVRVLCWVMTSPKTIGTKAFHVKQTWGKRCNALLFMSSEADKSLPAIGLNIAEGYDHLTAKSMAAFKYVYDNHLNDADWFMKADDDTYVILENLRYFLSDKNPEEAIYYGHHFKPYVKQGYFSGGAGYVLSKKALTKWHDERLNCNQDGGAEDVEIGKCLEKSGVKAGNSTDASGRTRFHCFNMNTHIDGNFPDWYYEYDANGAKKNTMSDYAITFHYVPPEQFYWLEYYVYHLRPYGITSGLQKLNHH